MTKRRIVNRLNKLNKLNRLIKLNRLNIIIMYSNVYKRKRVFFYITFSVRFWLKLCKSLSNNASLFTFVTLNKATYNCSWLKVKLRRFTLIVFRDYFWDLLIIMTKHRRIENCLRLSTHEYSLSVNKTILEMSRNFSLKFSFNKRVFIQKRCRRVIISRVSLASSCFWYRFRMSIMNVLSFSVKCVEDKQDEFKLYKNSADSWYMFTLSLQSVVSTEWKICAILSMLFKIY